MNEMKKEPAGQMPMLFINGDSTDPYRNLAEEEYLLKHFEEPVFRLWRNSDSIIVGQNQNTLAEIDYDYVKKNGIKVVRRITGGGAVFHDLGNLNYTFIQRRIPGESTEDMFRRFTKPILDALGSIGVNATLEGRNDLLIDGKKFSGNAVCIWKERVLQHGTLLFGTSMSELSAALKSRPEKFVGKAVRSNRQRVTNISEHLGEERDVIWFRNFLGDYILTHALGRERVVNYSFTPQQEEEIENLRREKYATDEWNFGHSPKFSMKSVRKLPAGLLEFYYSVEKGRISEIEIKGDYFFTKPTEDFMKALKDTRFTKEAVAEKIAASDTGSYFSGVSEDEILSMFF